MPGEVAQVNDEFWFGEAGMAGKHGTNFVFGGIPEILAGIGVFGNVRRLIVLPVQVDIGDEEKGGGYAVR